MTDRPILMSAPMVLATIRECQQQGTGKTETRRLLYVERTLKRGAQIPKSASLRPGCKPPLGLPGKYWTTTIWNQCQPGDRLWVKETHALPHAGKSAIKRLGRGAIVYKADEGVKHGRMVQYDGRWKPSIFMKREYSRLTLTITDVKVQRIQDIRHADAKAEGVRPFAPHRAPQGGACDGDSSGFDDCARCAFKLLWAQINGPQSWFGNPWVAVIAFKPELKNVDAKS